MAWLLLQLISLPGEEGTPYRADAQDTKLLDALANSSDADTRNHAAKIRHIMSAFQTGVTHADDYAPGGRHDNDFAEFRDIAILPTADEIMSSEPAFLRQSSLLDDPESVDARLGMYIDNTFRLLREDMIHEMREELHIALRKKKGHHRGLVVNGLKLLDIFRNQEQKRANLWGLKFECLNDLWIFKKPGNDVKKRTLYLQDLSTKKYDWSFDLTFRDTNGPPGFCATSLKHACS